MMYRCIIKEVFISEEHLGSIAKKKNQLLVKKEGNKLEQLHYFSCLVRKLKDHKEGL